MFLTALGTGAPTSRYGSGDAVVIPSPFASDVPKKISPGLSPGISGLSRSASEEPVGRDPPHLLEVLQILGRRIRVLELGTVHRIGDANFVLEALDRGRSSSFRRPRSGTARSAKRPEARSLD